MTNTEEFEVLICGLIMLTYPICAMLLKQNQCLRKRVQQLEKFIEVMLFCIFNNV